MVTNRYSSDDDTYSEVSWVDAAVGVLAAETSSWGQIKALFVADQR